MAKRRPRDETRQLILEEAHQMVREQGLPEAMGFRLNDALESLNLTTGAAYNIWESQDDFRVDLALHIARSYEWARASELEARAGELPEDIAYLDFAQRLSEAYFDSFVERPEFFLALYFWTVPDPSPELNAAIREGYDVMHEAGLQFFAAILERYDYEVVEPYTLSSLAVSATAALEGAALRYRFDPEQLQVTEGPLFGQYMASLFATTTRPRTQKAA